MYLHTVNVYKLFEHKYIRNASVENKSKHLHGIRLVFECF